MGFRKVVLVLFAGACAAAVAEPQKAAPDETLATCRNADGVTSDARIDACTIVIEKGGHTPARLASLHTDRALAWMEKGDFAKALVDADQAVQAMPEEATFLAGRGAIYSRLKEETKARADLDKAVALEPDNAVFRTMRATVLRRLNDYDGAFADFSEAIRLKPTDAGVRVDRGFSYLLKGDVKAALDDLSQAIQLDPKKAEAYKWRSTAYRRSSQDDLALKDVETALELDPKDPDSLSIRGRIRADQGLVQPALADIDAAAALEPGNFNNVLNRCQVRLQLDVEIETALAVCADALRMKPLDADALSYHGVLLAKLGRLDEARRDFKTCIDDQLARPKAEREEFDHAFCLYGRGLIAAKLNPKNMQGAITDMANAAQMQPGIPTAFTKYGLPPPRVAAAPPAAPKQEKRAAP